MYSAGQCLALILSQGSASMVSLPVPSHVFASCKAWLAFVLMASTIFSITIKDTVVVILNISSPILDLVLQFDLLEIHLDCQSRFVSSPHLAFWLFFPQHCS